LKRWKERESYFFDGYTAIEDGHLVYRKPDGTLNGNMPKIPVTL